MEGVTYIYSLPIDGKPISGEVFSNSETVVKICRELLGIKPTINKDTEQCTLLFKRMLVNFAGKRQMEATKANDVQIDRAFLFYLVFGQINDNSSGARGHAFILQQFRKFERYAWGPVCLACLYTMLTRAAKMPSHVLKKG